MRISGYGSAAPCVSCDAFDVYDLTSWDTHLSPATPVGRKAAIFHTRSSSASQRRGDRILRNSCGRPIERSKITQNGSQMPAAAPTHGRRER